MSDLALDRDLVDRLTRGRLGRFDVPCPACGPWRRAPANRLRRVLRIWRLDPSFCGYHCARCGLRGHVRERAVSVDAVALQLAREEAAERERAHAAGRLRTARRLWSRRRPLERSPAERYLREARGYRGPLPATLAFLPARGDHGPAMIAAIGLPHEPEPGVMRIEIDAVAGVHLTRLAPDGRGKAGTAHDKIMIGSSVGAPIVLAPVNDGLGLAISEGIEDALSAHESTGLGAWAAGSASRLPALAAAVPGWVEAVSILVDDDEAGWRHGEELGRRLDARGMEISLVLPARRAEGSPHEHRAETNGRQRFRPRLRAGRAAPGDGRRLGKRAGRAAARRGGRGRDGRVVAGARSFAARRPARQSPGISRGRAAGAVARLAQAIGARGGGHAGPRGGAADRHRVEPDRGRTARAGLARLVGADDGVGGEHRLLRHRQDARHRRGAARAGADRAEPPDEDRRA
jgi:hypothetical protein